MNVIAHSASNAPKRLKAKESISDFTWNFFPDLEQQPQASTSGNEYTSILKVGPLTAEMSKAVYECRAGNEVDSVMSRYTLPGRFLLESY